MNSEAYSADLSGLPCSSYWCSYQSVNLLKTHLRLTVYDSVDFQIDWHRHRRMDDCFPQ